MYENNGVEDGADGIGGHWCCPMIRQMVVGVEEKREASPKFSSWMGRATITTTTIQTPPSVNPAYAGSREIQM